MLVSAHMGSVKTLDREYLSTHPEGDEKAKLTFSGKVPSSIPVPLNPDGTRASVTLKVTGDTYMDLIQSLNALHDDEAEQFFWELIDQAVTDADSESISSPEEAAALLKSRTHEVVVPFRTFIVEMTIGRTDSFGTTTSSDVVFELTTPSISAGAALALDVSIPSKLTQVAIGLCPVTDMDDEELGDEVLVVS